MDEDQLLRKLGAAAAEADGPAVGGAIQGVDDGVWDRLVAGELTAEEVADLERRAQTDEKVAMLLSAFHPIDAASRDRMASDIAAHVTAAAEPTSKEKPHAAPVSLAERRERRAAQPAPWRSRVYAGMTALALAAGIGLFLSRSGSSAPLPLYGIDVNEAASMRGPSTDPSAQPGAARGCALRASRRGSFEVLARADKTGTGEVTAAAFLVRGEGLEPWTGALEVSATGSVRIADASERLVGGSELRIVVGRTEQLAPADAREKARRGEAAGAGWQVLRCTITPSAD